MPTKLVMAGPVIVTGVVGFVVGIDVIAGVGVTGADPVVECVGVIADVDTCVTAPVLPAVLPCVAVEPLLPCMRESVFGKKNMAPETSIRTRATMMMLANTTPVLLRRAG
jgi:hypothetical protein